MRKGVLMKRAKNHYETGFRRFCKKKIIHRQSRWSLGKKGSEGSEENGWRHCFTVQTQDAGPSQD